MLASIQRITDLQPIENADKIERARVLGWDVVVKKGEFSVGDLCIYIQIDTLIPNAPWSEFLFKGSDEGKEYYRLRTIKLRKQISQGLVLPVLIPEFINSFRLVGENADHFIVQLDSEQLYIENFNDGFSFPEGTDVTDYLGIKKYEKPLPQQNARSGMQRRGHFPPFIIKTDEERIQNDPKRIEKLKGKPYEITLKMDGTSFTAFNWDGRFGVCSRNLELKNPWGELTFSKRIKIFFQKLLGKPTSPMPYNFPIDIYWRMAKQYRIEEWLPKGYCIQGEIVGPGIQENKLGLTEPVLYIFNVYDIPEARYINPRDWCMAWAYIKEIPVWCPDVPLVERGDSFNYTMEELLEKASDLNYENGTPAEGIVVRAKDQSISFKVVSNRFLLQYGE